MLRSGQTAELPFTDSAQSGLQMSFASQLMYANLVSMKIIGRTLRVQ